MSAQKTCPRIVLVDDEEFTHEMVDLVLRESLRRYTLAKFLNRDEAWQELLRGGPRGRAPPLSPPPSTTLRRAGGCLRGHRAAGQTDAEIPKSGT